MLYTIPIEMEIAYVSFRILIIFNCINYTKIVYSGFWQKVIEDNSVALESGCLSRKSVDSLCALIDFEQL